MHMRIGKPRNWQSPGGLPGGRSAGARRLRGPAAEGTASAQNCFAGLWAARRRRDMRLKCAIDVGEMQVAAAESVAEPGQGSAAGLEAPAAEEGNVLFRAGVARASGAAARSAAAQGETAAEENDIFLRTRASVRVASASGTATQSTAALGERAAEENDVLLRARASARVARASGVAARPGPRRSCP